MVRLCRRGRSVCALGPPAPMLLVAALAAGTPSALAQPNVEGRWDPFPDGAQPYDWPPGFTMHAVRLPGGKVLSWWQAAPGHTQPHLWDQNAHQFTLMQADLPLGCSGHAQVWGSPLIVGGGDPDASCYHSVANATKFQYSAPAGWVEVTPLVFERWYPSATTLSDSKILVTFGHRDV